MVTNKYVKVISWNINGCGNQIKRRKVLAYLKSKCTDIAFIQESHIAEDEEAGKFQRDWVGQVYHSSYSSKRNGVMILVNKNLSFVMLKQKKDVEGRIICIEALINGIRTILCNIYAPNKGDPVFFHEVNTLVGDMEGQVILAGDFNQVMDGILDKSKPRSDPASRDRAAIHMLAEDLSLVDIWRLVNPSEREYTFYSHCHKSHSRIDFFLISNTLIDSVVDCKIGAIALSDHGAVELHIDLQTDRDRKGRWRLNTKLLQDEVFSNALSEDLKSFFEINIGSTSTIASVWEASKAYIRGKIIAQASKIKREDTMKMTKLEKEICAMEKDLARHNTDELYQTICRSKYQLHKIFNKKAEYALFRLKSNFYEGGEKCGKLLARQLKHQDISNNIPVIKRGNGTVTSSKEINKVFEDFYKDLYTSDCTPTTEEVEKFFSGLQLPAVSGEQSTMLDAPITEDEIRTSILSMKNGKSPGLDGFPIEYYKKFIDILAPILHEVYLEAFEVGSLPTTLNDALITLIPKKDRDTSDPSSFRPVSLLGVDCKILTKTLASRLERVLPDVINGDQVGFIKHRSSVDNMRRLMHLIHLNSTNPIPIAALSLDAEKAFDRVEWGFLMAALSKFKFGPGLCHWIRVLYSNPRAAVLTNGVISNFFGLSRGTRQGCSLSPLLFTIVLEPLAIAIRSEIKIKGVQAGGREHKLFMYADDILAVVAEPADSLPVLLECIDSYSLLSGYKINWHKSEGMPISNACHSGDITVFNFKWVPVGMRYLGIQLHPNLKEIMLLNVQPLLHKMKTNLEKWGKLKLTLWGKVNVIKMVIAPQFNYVSMMLPVEMPPVIFKNFDNIVRHFLWDGKRPRINIKKMWSSREVGGLGLPNVKLYNLAFEMTRLSEHWEGTNTELSWIKIEQELVAPFTFVDILSHGRTDVCDHSSNPVMAHAKSVWREVHRMCKVSHWRQSYASLWHNKDLRIGKRTIYWDQWLKKGIHKISDLYMDGSVVSFSELLQKFNLERTGNFWKYLQIRDCITKGNFMQGQNPLMDFLDMPGPVHKASGFYKLFTGQPGGLCNNLKEIWQKDLECEFSAEEWLAILSNTGKYIREARGKFIQYKLIHRFYFTPSRLHRMGLLTNNKCWKCHTEVGTFVHVLWECKLINPFWGEVLKHMEKGLGMTIPKSPRLCLLGDRTEIPTASKYDLAVIKVGIVSAALIILRLWKSTTAPECRQWLELMSEIVSYEHMLARVDDANEKAKNSWDRFFAFGIVSVI